MKELSGESNWCDSISEEVIVSKIVTENEGSNGGKLDKNVDGWTGSILEWISYGISDNSSDMLFSEFHLFFHPVVSEDSESISIETVFDTVFNFDTILGLLTSELMGSEDVVLSLDIFKIDISFNGLESEDGSVLLDLFLGVIPSTTGVRLGDSDLNTGDNGSSKDTSSGVWSEDETSAEWGSNNEDSWGDHLFEGSFGGDSNATFIVWEVIHDSISLLLLSDLVIGLNEFHHSVSGISDGSHGEGSEEIWEHSTDKESSELGGLRISTEVSPILVMKAPKRASPTRQADPIAKPLPTAAVVFPAASRASVISLIADGSPHISAHPPALSEIGPYPSTERATGRDPSIPRAERPIPYIPALAKPKPMVAVMQMIGTTTERYPRASPRIMFGAGPLLQDSARWRVGP